jgi:TolA-binding protein
MFKHIFATSLLLFFGFGAYSQITLNQEHPDIEFTRALNSYEKQLYNKSVRGFERYLQTERRKDYTIEAKYYISSSKLRLMQASGVESAENFIETYPKSERVLFLKRELADYYYMSGKYKQASKFYRQVDVSILEREESDEFLFRKGYSLFQDNKFQESKDAFYPLTLRPTGNYVKAMYYYGYVCYKNGEYREALESFLKIEEKGPQTMKLYICQMYYLKGDYEKAIDYANKVNLGKLDNEKNVVIGKSYYRLRDFAKASEYFNKAYTSYDDLNEEEMYEIGYSYFKTGQCNQAFLAFSPIANKGTAMSQLASYHLAECFLKANKKQNAYNAFFEAQRTDFDKEIKENAMLNLGKLALEQGDYKTAISTFNKFLDFFPQSKNQGEAQKLLASVFLVTNDYKTAIPILENLKNPDEESKSILHQIMLYHGEELFINKNIPESKSIFTKASLKKENGMAAALSNFWLGEIEFYSKKTDLAKNYYNKFLTSGFAKETPYYTYVHYALGYCEYENKNHREALNYFNRFKSLNKEKPEDIRKYDDAILRIADCYYALNQNNEALENYAYISGKKAASSDYALFQQGMIFGLQSKSAQKISVMKRIVSEFANSVWVEHSIFEIASEWLMRENFQEAERNFRYLLDDFPQSKYVKKSLFSLGLMYYNQEKDDKALDEFKYLVQNFPGTAETREAIGYIERIYISRGESDKYLAWLEKVPNADISVAFRDSVSYQAAFNLYVNGNCSGAIQNFNKYLKDFPNAGFNLSARFYLATCMAKTSGFESAVPYYKQIIEARPNEFKEETAKRLAAYYYAQKNYSEAIVYYGELEINSSDKQNLQNAFLGQLRCAYELDDLETAEKKGGRLLLIENISLNVSGEVQNKIATLHYEKQNFKDALVLFEKTLEKNKDEYGAEAFYFKAQILFDNSKSEEAKKMVFEYNKQFASFYYWQGRCFVLLAEIYKREGDVFQAKATVNFVLENYTDEHILQLARDLKNTL